MRDISVALLEHYNKAKEKFPHTTILGVFLYGSQNYNIATEESDVDTIAILIPSFEDLVLETPISKEIRFKNGEHCVVKDIREIVKQWEKQSLNYLEILFTDYYIINPTFQKEWDKFLEEREFIARMDLNKAIKSISAQARNTYLKNKTNKKYQANALRLFFFLQDLILWKPYKDCLTSHHDLVYKVKTGECESPYKEDFVYQLNTFMDKHTGTGFLPDTETMNFLNTMLCEIVRKNTLL